MTSLLAGCLVAMALLAAPAGAAELKVLATGAQTDVFKELIPSFEKATGHKVTADYAATPQVMKKIEGGDPFDLVVMIDTPIKDPANQKYFAEGPRPPVCSVGLGAAVRAGAPKPDLSTPEAFKQALLKAKSVAILPESINGKHFLAVFEKLGIADEMKAKLKPVNAPADVAPAVAKGDAAEATKWLNAMDKKLRAGHVWKSDKEALVQSEPSLIAPAAPAAK